jgi:hypothetical protein
MRLADAAMDFVFGNQKNNLVTPTEGRGLASKRLLAFAAENSVHHQQNSGGTLLA